MSELLNAGLDSQEDSDPTYEPISVQSLSERAAIEEYSTLVDILGISADSIVTPQGADALTATTQTVGPNTPNDPDDA